MGSSFIYSQCNSFNRRQCVECWITAKVKGELWPLASVELTFELFMSSEESHTCSILLFDIVPCSLSPRVTRWEEENIGTHAGGLPVEQKKKWSAAGGATPRPNGVPWSGQTLVWTQDKRLTIRTSGHPTLTCCFTLMNAGRAHPAGKGSGATLEIIPLAGCLWKLCGCNLTSSWIKPTSVRSMSTCHTAGAEEPPPTAESLQKTQCLYMI